MKPFFVYILECADGSYYCGHTDDLEMRLSQHETTNVGYTATRKPLTLKWQAEFESRLEALEFERRVKGWSRAKKQALFTQDWDQIKALARRRTNASAMGFDKLSPNGAMTQQAESLTCSGPRTPCMSQGAASSNRKISAQSIGKSS